MSESFGFGRIEIRPAERQLLVDGQKTKVGARAFDLLMTLVESRERVVSKNELLDLVWPGLVVEENNLQVHISTLRKVLGPQSIATIPGRGYRFTLAAERRGPSTPAAADSVAPHHGVSGNLPAHVPTLFGRSADVSFVAQMLYRHRVVSVVGPGGIGKTRLALAIAHELRLSFDDGAWLIELAPISDPSLIVATIGRLLGLPLAAGPNALDTLVDAIKDHRLLLVLDNCEHMIGSVHDVVSRLIAGTDRLRILLTSQEPLRAADEQVYRLAPLGVPDVADVADVESATRFGAVALFVARAEAADRHFVLTGENVGAVSEICAALDGNALAIELAAARVSLLGMRGVLARLDERLRLLAGGARREAMPRHQTLRAALEWSYGLLSGAERIVFDRLGVFVGSFSLETAQHVASDATIDAWAALDCLASLVDKSLVFADSGERPRYRLLENNRAMALEHLQAAGSLETLRRRHAEAIAQTLTAAEWNERPSERMVRVGPDLDNVRAAAAWAIGPNGDRSLAVALAGATWILWDLEGCNDEGDRLYRTVAPWVDDNTEPLAAARFWLAVCDVRLFIGVDRQAQAGAKAVALFRQLALPRAQFYALIALTHKLNFLGDRVRSDEALAEARSVHDPSWPAWTGVPLEFIAGGCRFFGYADADGARRHYEAAEQLLGRCGGDAYWAAQIGLMLHLCCYALGDDESAAQRARAILDQSARRAGAWIQSIARVTFGATLVALGQLDLADALLRSSVPKVRRTTGSAYWTFNHVAFLLARRARFEDAARLIGYVDVDGSQAGRTVLGNPSQRRSHGEACALVAAALAPDVVARLQQDGRRLSEDQAIALAFRQ